MQQKANQQPDLTQLHPYQYLTELNSIFNACNKANAKSYSSVSKIKLAWKPFNIIKIPQCFEVTYENQHKNNRMGKCEGVQDMDESQRKIWKEHQDIIRRYANRDRKNFNPRPHSSVNYNRRTKDKTNTIDGQSEQILKKFTQKGAVINYDKNEVVDEVIKKLKMIQTQKPKKQAWRAQSATVQTGKETDVKINQQAVKSKGEYYLIQKPYAGKQRKDVDENQYLFFNKNSQIVAKYKQRINQVDCAISELNVKKTNNLLRNMENIVKSLQ